MSFSIPSQQTQIVLRERPKAAIQHTLGANDSTYEKRTIPVPKESELKDGEVLVRVEYVSLDPAMRGWLRDARSYLPPVQIGEVMRAGGVGVVVASKFAGLNKGDQVSGTLGWQQYAQVPGKSVEKRTIREGSNLLDYLGPLGSSGQTAYWGILDVAAIKSGDVVVVTGAAGSVGSIVVQIAKLKGCKVIAVAGADDKCEWLKSSLGADEALNYKSPDFKKTYREMVTKKYGYIDAIFENVGGEILDMSLLCMKPHARIALCGAISDYNNPKPDGLKNYQTIIAMRIKLQGFIVFDYAKRYAEAEEQMSRWMNEGKLARKFHVVGEELDAKAREQGKSLELAPKALVDLFAGKNSGKMVVKVAA
ncbi:Alcohol dehydrogenase, C-terminal [Kalmanozyma brasiliensis GHG001]|uniref:Enoyl reductase (ER) domain-containing protein n=1 Tax=Kalmanozyma brasiliensis (strain GHG001) TaxID=1365824 RepID=V5EGA8_KALBG|nr:Alcohol dehydrogenase, C-terminal [Kalmanozyma brasiliensis GHG001]EST09566.1 Alcohol dehydrogenase, C-terminal [Kalmanozyma brasiliensis GHG001]